MGAGGGAWRVGGDTLAAADRSDFPNWHVGPRKPICPSPILNVLSECHV